ncbi:hypothetical protein SLS60_004884 [Paraconiothyrium brasiliense]|uniref:Uncharacterized protein n=1 Tax=Paraconiothyrium brasiliense TaxID=300254 RepID=A0ABR3RLK5_9PLEO
MSGPLESSTSTVTPASPSNSSISTAAKAGIAIGAIFCILLAILLGVVLLRRRKRNPQYPPEYSHAPPPLAPGLYSSPPPVQQPLHVQTTGNAGFTPAKADVSPIEEKTPAFAVSRKEVGGVASPQSQGTPVMRPAQVSSPAPTEIEGSMPPPRHEVHHDAAPGGYADGGQGRWVYEMQGQTQAQGQGRDGVYELGGGR